MAVVAKIQFTQGATVGVAGRALFGDLAAEVTVANETNTNVRRWRFELLAAPEASALVPGVVQDGGASTYKFTPDARGGYLFMLTVTDVNGFTSKHTLCFGVKETNGLFLPPFSGKASAVNFSGQLRGWAKYIEEWLTAVALTVLPGADGDVLTVVDGVWASAPPSGGTPGGADHSAQYNDNGAFGGEDAWTYPGSGEQRCTGGFMSFGAVHAASGDVRLPRGNEDATSWSIRQRNAANDGDVTTVSVDRYSGGLNSLWLGSDPQSSDGSLSPDPATAYDDATLTAKHLVSLQLVAADTVFDGDYSAAYLDAIPDPTAAGIYAGKLMTNWKISQHVNFSIAGQRQYPDADDFGRGRGIFFFGRANVLPTANPTAGIQLWVDAADDLLRYRMPDGTVIVLDGAGGFSSLTDSSTGTINDVATTDSGSPVTSLRLTGAAPVITGFASGTAGRQMVVHAIGGPVILQNESGSSTAGNRIATINAANLPIPQGSSVLLTYDATTERWRPVLNRETISTLANSSTGTINDATTTSGGAPTSGVRFSGAAPSVTGFANGTSGRLLQVMATGGDLTLVHEGGTSTAANRIVTSTAANVTVPNGAAAILVYDGTTSRWRLAGVGTVGGSGVSPGTQNQVLRTTDAGVEWGADDRAVLVNSGTTTLDDLPTVDGDGNHIGTLIMTGAGHIEVSGFDDGYDGRELVVHRRGGTMDLNDLSTDSAVGNRIDCGAWNTVATIEDGGSARLVWRPAISPETDGVWQLVDVAAPAASVSAPSGTGLATVTSGAFSGSALAYGAANTVLTSNGSAGVWATVVNANVDAAAAIAGTKIAPNFGSQLVQTTGAVQASYFTPGGTLPADGLIRIPYNAGAQPIIKGFWSSGNEVPILTHTNGTTLLGDTSATLATVQIYAYSTYIWGGTGGLHLYGGSSGATAAIINGTSWAQGLPRHGNSTPYASEGQYEVDTAPGTLSAAAYSRFGLMFTNAATSGQYDFPAPATEDQSYKKIVHLRTSDATYDFGIVGGGEEAIVQTVDGPTMLWITPEGVFRVSEG